MTSIRAKTIVSFVAVFLVLFSAVIFCAYRIVIKGFHELERRQMQENLQRATAAVANELDELNKTVGDWAPWTESYHFVDTLDPEYIDDNLSDAAISNIQLNVIVYTRRDGRVAYAKFFDLRTKRSIPVPANDLRTLMGYRRLFQHPSLASHVTGIIQLPDGLLCVAAQPLRKSDGTGPANGTLLMGRYLSAAEIARLSRLTGLTLQLDPFASPHLSRRDRAMRATLRYNGDSAIAPLSASRLRGITRLDDLRGRPAAVLQVVALRDIAMHGRLTVRLLVFSMIALGVILGVTLLIVVERSVLTRLSWLSHEVQHIGVDQQFSARIAPSASTRHPDEFDSLIREINAMLAALEQAHRTLVQQEALRKSEERYRAIVEYSPSAVCIVRDQAIAFLNGAAKHLLGVDDATLGTLRTASDLFAPEQTPEITDVLVQASHGATIAREEISLRRSDGHTLCVELTATPLTYEDRPAVQLVMQDITQRKEADAAIRHNQARLRALASSLATAEETERRRLAADLHDHLGQTLVVARLLLGTVKDQLGDATVCQRIEEIRVLLEEGIEWARSLTGELCPPMLIERGLVPAVRWLAELLQARHGLHVAVDTADDADTLTMELRSVLFRMVRELLLNIVKHAHATTATVAITCTANVITVQVTDDGVGMEPRDDADDMRNIPGFGLFSIRERVHHFGGTFAISSSAGNGTIVLLTVPNGSVNMEIDTYGTNEHCIS